MYNNVGMENWEKQPKQEPEVEPETRPAGEEDKN